MPTKSKKPKSTKKVPTGWKREGGGYAYFFKETVASRYQIKKIDFPGFKQPPVGLNLVKTGGGFNLRQVNKVGGSHFLSFLKDKYGRQVKLTVFANGSGASFFKVQKTTIVISIYFDHFKELLKNLGDEIKQKRDEVIRQRLENYFPKEFKDPKSSETASVKLKDINLNTLDENDHNTIAGFIKRYISINSENDEILKNLQNGLVIEGRKKTLDQVIKKFEKHIKDKKFDEKKWQKFLHEDVFFFLSNYVESIREADVNFGKEDEGAKKPDFVWIDTYGFLDVFEIKTPVTDVLARRIDTSHNNYYFSSQAAKAISQIEKYILFLEGNIKGFESHLSKQTKVPFSVLRPKAFLIIGNSKEFESNPEKKKDFRVLRRLLKNIEFITFDELLDNLKSLANKFEKITK